MPQIDPTLGTIDPYLPSEIKPALYYYDEYQTYDLMILDKIDRRICQIANFNNTNSILYQLLKGETEDNRVLIERFFPYQNYPYAYNYGLILLDKLKKYASSGWCEPFPLYTNPNDKNGSAVEAAVIHGSFLGVTPDEEELGIKDWINPDNFFPTDFIPDHFINNTEYIYIPSKDFFLSQGLNINSFYLSYLRYDVTTIPEYIWVIKKIIIKSEPYQFYLPEIQPWSLVFENNQISTIIKSLNFNFNEKIKLNWHNQMESDLDKIINWIDVKLPDIGKVLISLDINLKLNIGVAGQFNDIQVWPSGINTGYIPTVTYSNYNQIDYPINKRFFAYIFGNNTKNNDLIYSDIINGQFYWHNNYSFYPKYDFDNRDYLTNKIDYKDFYPLGKEFADMNNDYQDYANYIIENDTFLYKSTNNKGWRALGKGDFKHYEIKAESFKDINDFLIPVNNPELTFLAHPINSYFNYTFLKDNRTINTVILNYIPFLSIFFNRHDKQSTEKNYNYKSLFSHSFNKYLTIFNPLWSELPLFVGENLSISFSANNIFWENERRSVIGAKQGINHNFKIGLFSFKNNQLELIQDLSFSQNLIIEQIEWNQREIIGDILNTTELIEYNTTLSRSFNNADVANLYFENITNINDIIYEIDQKYYNYYLDENNKIEFTNYMPDSQRIKEIHASLNAQKFAYDDDNDPTVARVANLGYYLERLARIWGISVNSDGSIRSIRQKRHIAVDDSTYVNSNGAITFPDGWTFGQWAVNYGGGTDGQIGGNPDEERDGIIYEVRSNYFDKDDQPDKVLEGGYLLCENWPQYLDSLLDDLDKALGWQNAGADVLTNADGTELVYFEGLYQIIQETAYMLSELSKNIKQTHILSAEIQSEVKEIISQFGLPTTVKSKDISIGDDVGKLPYVGFNPTAPTLHQLITVLLMNLSLINNAVLTPDIKEEDLQ